MSQLQGLRVLELADGLVDLGGRMLAEMGATVVSVAHDDARPHARQLAWGHGKHRLLRPDDPAELAGPLAGADILLDDRRRGTMLSDAAIAMADSLIHVIARPYCPAGPQAGQTATDITLMAQSGLMTITGDPDRPPLRFPGEQAYALTGIQCVTAALLALRARRRTGRGQRIEVSALQAATLANYREAIVYEWTGRIGHRTGNRLVRGTSGVRQVWACADGYVTWSMVDNPGMMRAVVRVMAEHGVAGELGQVVWDGILVADLPQEVIERWEAIIAAFFASQSKAQLGEWSLENGWGLSVIHDLGEVRASEHLAERGLFVPVLDDETGTGAMLPGPLFRHGADGPAPERRLTRPAPASDFPGWEAL